MKFLILIIVLSVLLTNCGFKPIYSSKSSNFEIINIVNKNENKNSFAVEEMVMSVSNENAKRNRLRNPCELWDGTINLFPGNPKEKANSTSHTSSNSILLLQQVLGDLLHHCIKRLRPED